MLLPIAPPVQSGDFVSSPDTGEIQSRRADEFVARVNSAITESPLRQQWDVPLGINPSNGIDCAAARWAAQRFNAEQSGYRAELSEKGNWTLRVTLWNPF